MRPLVLLICVLLGTGCRGNGDGPWGLELPGSRPQGTIDEQRSRAVLHDPYPDAYAGPVTDGMRPREFQRPLPETVKNRGLKDPWWQR